MCSEIQQLSSFLRRMSGTGNDHPRISPNQENVAEEADSKSLQSESGEEREKGKTQDGGAADNPTELPEHPLVKNEDGETDEATASHRELSEDEDGFKTPTSSVHRIPAITQCPPAPIKLRPLPSKLKRKAAAASPTAIQPDAAEIESIFSSFANDIQDHAQRRKIKKARTEDQ